MQTVSPIVKIGWKETVIDPDATAALAKQFEAQHALVLEHVFDAEFLRNLAGLIDKAQFVEKHAPHVGTRKIEQPAFAGFYLRQALTRPAMQAWLETVTGCGPLGGMIGNITQYAAGSGHHLGWHHDVDAANERRLAVTVNLGTTPYDGGDFEMRERGGTELLMRYAHAEPGTALVFRVTKALEHRVTPVISGGPRMVFSGWFLARGAQTESDSAP